MAASDGVLVERTLAGEQQAFGVLVERYGALVHALILERVRRRDEVEDLVQEAFCFAYQALSRLRQPARFAPWLCQIARTTALHWLRHEGERSRVESLSDAWLPASGLVPDEELERDERVQALWATLDHLLDDTRQLVVLHHLEGCSYRQIARFLDIPVTTVRWRVLRAQRQVIRGVARMLGESTPTWQADRRRLSARILAGLPISLPWTRDTEALGPAIWSAGRLLSLLKLVAPSLVGVAVIAGVVGSVLVGDPASTHGSGVATNAGTVTEAGVRLRLGPARSGSADGSEWAHPPTPPSAAGWAPWVATAPAAEPAPPPTVPLPNVEPTKPVDKPVLRATEPRREQRPRPGILMVITVQHQPQASPYERFPSAIPNLLAYLRQQSKFTLPARCDLLQLGAPEMKDATLLFLPARAGIVLSEAERRDLGEYLKADGMLFADVYDSGNAFEKQLKAYLRDPLVLGGDGQNWQPVPRDHGLYSCFFEFTHGPPRGAAGSGTDDLEMLERRGRMVVLLSHLNITWYWSDEFASRRYEEGLRFGVNLLVYAWSQQMSR